MHLTPKGFRPLLRLFAPLSGPLRRPLRRPPPTFPNSGPAQDEARDRYAFQPEPRSFEAALAAAAGIVREEATRGWPALHAMLSACDKTPRNTE